MIYRFLKHICENEFLLRSACPYNVQALFGVNHNVTHQDKKWFCAFIVLLRILKAKSLLVKKNEELLIFGEKYDHLDKGELTNILKSEISEQSAYLHFVSGRINMKNLENLISTKLNEHVLLKLIEDGEQ